MKIFARNGIIFLILLTGFFLIPKVEGQDGRKEKVMDEVVQEYIDMALLEAVFNKNSNDVDSLLALGANVNARDYPGLTAIMYGVISGDVDIINTLLLNGAEINAVDYSGTSVLMHAIIANQKEFIIEMMPWFTLINHQDQSGYSALVYAAQNGDLEILDALHKAGAIIDQKTDLGTTPLMHAAAFGNFFAVDFLAFHDADVNMQSKDKSSALHLASWYGHNEIVGLLLDWGANIDIRDSRENTPLMVAVMAGQLETTWYLIETGASLSAINEKGFSPLGLAISKSDEDITDLLLEYDFQEDDKAPKYLSPLAYAFFNRNVMFQKKMRSVVKPKGFYFSEFTLHQGFDFNGDDFLYLSSVGFFESRFKLWLQLNFATRIGHKKLRVRENSNTVFQYHEKRNIWSLGLYREFMLVDGGKPFKLGLLPGVEAGYAYGSYRGTGTKPPGGFTFVPVAGLYIHSGNFSLMGGYQYWNTGQKDITPNRFRVSLVYRFPFFSRPASKYRPVLR
jgi:ankyrin repeat protein